MSDLDQSPEDAANEQAIRKEQERIARQIEIDDFKFVMSHKQSRRFVWRLLGRYGIYRTSFSSDALEMARLEGQRNCGLQLMADIHLHAPERYIELLTEIKDDNRKRNAGSSNSRSDDDASSSGARGGTGNG